MNERKDPKRPTAAQLKARNDRLRARARLNPDISPETSAWLSAYLANGNADPDERRQS